MRFPLMLAIALCCLALTGPASAQCPNGQCQAPAQTVTYQGVVYQTMPATMPQAVQYRTGPFGFFRWRVRSAPTVQPQQGHYQRVYYQSVGCPGGTCPAK